MSHPCALCESYHPASFHCEECEQYMCEVMCKAHLKANVSKNHHLLSIDYDSEKWVEGYPLFCFTASDIQCPSHYLPYRYYDEVCKLRLCIDCYVLAHSRHACKSIAESLIEKNVECVEMFRSKTNELEVVNSLLHDTEKRAVTLQVEQTQTKTKIANAFRQVFERLQDRQQRLLQEVDSTYGERILLWTERKLELEEMIEEIKQSQIKFRKVLDLPCAAVVPFIQGGETKSSMDSEFQLMNQEFVLYSSLLAKTDLHAKGLMMITTDLEENEKNLSCFTKFIKIIENIGTELQIEDLEPLNETPAKSAPLYLNYPPHKTISPLTSALRLSEGKNYSIRSNGQEAVGAGIWGLRSWCQINPFPTGRSIILRAEFGTNSCLLFTLFHTSDIIDEEILESAMCGVCSWHVSSNTFYQRGVKVKAVNKVDLQPSDTFRFELKYQEFKCYRNNDLLHVFGIKEGEYRLVIYTYYPDTKIKIIA